MDMPNRTKEICLAAWMLQPKQANIRLGERGIFGQNEVHPHRNRTGIKKQWSFIAIVLGIAACSFLSYALMDRRYDAASANGQNPLPFPTRFTPSLRPDTAYVPAGTRINIRLKETIRTEEAIAGDRFTAVLYGPLIVGAQFLAPSRSKIMGQLTHARGPGTLGGPAQLAMVLQSLLVNGKGYNLATDPVALARAGRRQPIQRDQEAFGPEAQFTFMLSQPLELPVIRTMGPMAIGGSEP